MTSVIKPTLDMNHPALRSVTDEEITNVILELIAAIELMVPDRPYEAEFLIWPLWKKCPPGHHKALGVIVSAVVKTGCLPIRQDSRSAGSTRVKYFLITE